MPLSAATSAREILTGLHDVMAKRGSAQNKLDKVVDLIAEAMASEVCSIYLLRDNALELSATHGLRKEAVHVTRLGLGEGLVGTIAEEGRILNLAEAASHPTFAYRPETGEEHFHSFAGVPIIRREQAIGVLAVQHDDPRRYDHHLDRLGGKGRRRALAPLLHRHQPGRGRAEAADRPCDRSGEPSCVRQRLMRPVSDD